MSITYEQLKNNEQIRAYIEAGNATLKALGYTEHAFPHVFRTAETAASILKELGYPEETAEHARIAGLLHDIGNMVNRTMHALTGADIARVILEKLGMPYPDIGVICGAIGNHDEETGRPVNSACAAVILADKSDVRRSRVQRHDMDEILKDIHDRVNYAVERSEISVKQAGEKPVIRLCLDIDSNFTPVMDYFEIFLTRMLMCRRAAACLGADFELIINDLKIM
jgi:putative nucleotidyltransferase with HDIG domain